jgi:tight adherence protein B
MPAVAASSAAFGIYLLYTAVALGQRDLRLPAVPGASREVLRGRFRTWLTQSGLDDVAPRDFAMSVVVLFALGAALALWVFGGPMAAAVAGAFAASFPVAAARHRRRTRRATALDAWPRMIEEMRILITSVGRSIPQALFEVGRDAPRELQAAFEAGHREWLISTDLPRTVEVLKEHLGDSTGDVVCETLLIAHELGGTDLDRRLADLADDRRDDLRYRKDMRSRQAGVRFARRFVLVVPLGMALAGLSVGTGRDAYETPAGQTAVILALAMMAICWVWAGYLMRLPHERRVFDR